MSLCLQTVEYAGTLDLIVKTPKNDLCIIDTKTTYAIAHYVPVQLAGYYNLAHYNDINIRRCYVLHLKEDKYDLRLLNPDLEKWKEIYDQYKNQADQY